jgi:hypothetical protein
VKVYIVCVTDHKHVCALRAYASKQKAIKAVLYGYTDDVKSCGASGRQVNNNLIEMAATLADGLDYFDEDLKFTYVIREDDVKIENN